MNNIKITLKLHIFADNKEASVYSNPQLVQSLAEADVIALDLGYSCCLVLHKPQLLITDLKWRFLLFVLLQDFLQS